MKNKPKIIYSNMINLAGLYSNKPVICRNDKYFDLPNHWWDHEGDYSVSKLGLVINKDMLYIRFSSINKKEVELWMSGVKSTMKMLAAWTKNK